MDRRRFLAAGAGGAVAGAGIGYWAGKKMKLKAARPDWRPAAAQTGPHAASNDLATYFTESAMLEALGATSLGAPADCISVCYNFPSWHPTPFMEKALHPGWTEFETLKQARPLFPGHQMPRYPLWGYFNEADPAWAEKEIDAAADHGIDVWMIDWYWHAGTMFYQEQLEQGFLKARNSRRLKFAVMWANHHWRNVYPAPASGEAPMLIAQTHSEEDCVRVIDYCIDHYFHQPNYWRIDDALVFAIFDLGLMHKALGPDGLKRSFEKMRRRVAKAGLGELHIQSSHVHGRLEDKFRELGIDSATSYHAFGALPGERAPGGVSPYGDGAVASIRQWQALTKKSSVPAYPDCPVGWDPSPRFGRSAHMFAERTPDQYERLLRAARHFVAPQKHKVVFLSAWNEWTEDHVLLPDAVFGYSYLEAVRRALKR
jgi:hypothetical protein